MIPLGSANHPLGHGLLQRARHTKRSAVLVAPFIKKESFRRIIEALPGVIELLVVTRWRPDEVANGVSDPEIFTLVETRPSTSLRLLHELHAKYYRFDDEVLVGSANLTGQGLGWSPPGNVELLVTHAPIPAFEEQLLATSRAATRELMEAVLALASEINPTFQSTGLELSMSSMWLPATRHPADLFLVYAGETDLVSRASIETSHKDLEYLGLPGGLSQDSFRTGIRVTLRATAIFNHLEAALTRPRRFGEMADFLRDKTQLNRDEASEAWQTLLRWLLHFFPEEYGVSRPNHSEVAFRKSLLDVIR